MKFLGIIPARGGSKGIPFKGIVPCAGKPLLFYTAREAKKSKHLSRIILSTDSKKIAAVGRKLGIEVPFLRPAHLAQDKSPMIGVLQQALAWIERTGEIYDAIVLLQPTSPLRKSRHIDEAIHLFIKKNAGTVVSIVQVPHQYNPVSLMKMRGEHLTPYSVKKGPMLIRRQDKPLLYARNGPAVLVIRTDQVKRGRLYGSNVYGYVMAPEVSHDIDTPQDLAWVEHLMTIGKRR